MRKTEDRRREIEDGRRKTGDRRRKTGDGRRETEDRRRKTGDRSFFSSDFRLPTSRYMHIKRNTILSIILLFTLSFSSCDQNRIFEENIDIPRAAWEKANKLKFEVAITDTITPCNLFINIRNSSNYQFSNIYMFVDITFPNGKIYRDTVEGRLADVNGQWTGSGLGDIWDNKIPYKQSVRFPQTGKYIFEIEQAMRMDTLEDILDAGLRLEKR